MTIDEMRKYRLFNISLIDFVGTIICGVILAKWQEWDPLITCIFLILISIPIHKAFKVKTTLST